tara:strand:- start:314 stop:496 length:183 start_codon:yes stop_codon:yes gene_type:complete
MGLSSFKVFDIKPVKKPVIRRVSTGEFLSKSYCYKGSYIIEQYISLVRFDEATSGSIILN